MLRSADITRNVSRESTMDPYFPPRMVQSAPSSSEHGSTYNNIRLRYRRERTLPSFPGWFFSRVANRRAHRRLHSEPPQNFNRGHGSGPLPAANQNGTMVVQNGGTHGIASNNDARNRNIHPSNARRMQSLPPRKPGAAPINDDAGRSRIIKSAPDNNPPIYGKPSHVANQGFGNNNRSNHAFNNAPPQARSRLADYDTAAAGLHQKTHGITTSSYEENYLRSNKFASSWARVRADNPTFLENSPGQTVPEKGRDDSSSPGRSSQRHSIRETSPGRMDASPYDTRIRESHHTRGRPPFRRRPMKKQKHSRSRSPKASNAASQKENQPPLRDTDEESGSGEEGDDIYDFSIGTPVEFDESQAGKSPRRQPWNDSVVVPVSTRPPPKLDARRCRQDLTFKPAVNTDHIVTKTYSGQDDIVPRGDRVTFDDNLPLTDDEEGYASPGNESSPGSNDNSLDRKGGKERMLTRREAKMYIKMMNVYGSDAFKRQRKEWFVKKLNEVHEAKTKFEEQEKRNLQKKRNEDRLRQERQLNYVRNKFRREQMHRFQTQYVTARVLEYEKSTRQQYGLPEDFEDLAFLLKDDDDAEQNGAETAEDPTKENNMKGNSNNQNAQQSNTKNKKNASQPPLTKKQKAEKQRAQKEREEEERQKEQERKARQKQSAWYTHPDTQPNRQESPTSYGTSGYESEKSPSEHNGNVDQEPIHDTKVKGGQFKQKTDQKRKDGRPEKPSEAQNRLASQKNIYEKKPQNRMQQRPVMVTDNAINKSNPQKRKGLGDANKTAGIHTSDAGNNADAHPPREHERETVSTSNPQQREKDKPKDIAHVAAGSPEKPALKNKPPEKFPSKSNGQEVNDKKSQPNRNRLPSQGADKSKKAADRSEKPTQFEAAAVPSKDDGSHVFKSKAEEKPPRPPQTKSQTADVNNNRNKQPIDDKKPVSDKNVVPRSKEEMGLSKSDQNQQSSNKSPSDATSSPTDKGQTSQKSGPVKPVVDDDAPINIKRFPLAGAISKENAPQTFGVTENKLENMLSSPQTQQANGAQSTSAPTKEPPKDAQRPKPGTSKGTSKENTGPNKPAVVVRVDDSHTTADKSKLRSAKSNTSNGSQKAKPKKSETLADKMFNIKTGPTWNPHSKVPKMEGIDTVVVTGKDSKGRPVRKKRDVDNVVREASNLLKVSEKDGQQRGSNSKHRIVSRAPSPAAVTLGSDFDVDDDDELEQEDIFERLRKKYNIAIDSDDEDDLR